MTYHNKQDAGIHEQKGDDDMSSCKFQGGKCKGGSEVSAYLRHSDGTVENRARVKEAKERKGEYCNIDVSRSKLNYSIDVDTLEVVDCVSYSDMWDKYKAREIEVENLPTNTNHRKDRVTAIFVEIPFPMSLTGDGNREKGKEWARNVVAIFQKKYGKENVVSATIHADEVHDYIDVRDNVFKESRYHIHLCLVAEHDGGWNGKWISKQSNLTYMNRQVEQMTQKDFGVSFMTGEKYKSRKSIQALKAESAALEAKADFANREKMFVEMLQKQSDLRKDIEVLEDTKKKSLSELKQLSKEKSELEDEIERIRVANDDAEEKMRRADTRYKEAVETYKEVNKDAEDLINDINNLFMTRYQEFINRRDTDLSRKAFLEGRKMKTKDGEVISEEEFYKRCSAGKKAEQDKEIEKEKKEAIEEAERLLSKYREMHEERVRQAEKIIAVPSVEEEDEDDDEDENNVDIFLTKKMLRKMGM